MSDDRYTRTRAPNKVLPSAEYLRACFTYNRKSGVLWWKKRPREHFLNDGDWSRWNTKHAGKIAGCIGGNAYRQLGLHGRMYLTHRIIYKLVTGKEPPATIDHKRGKRASNRWNNLRTATQIQQCYNTPRPKNTSGYRCVYPQRINGRWYAQIRINKIKTYLGTYDTPQQASAVVEPFLRKLHGKFYRPPAGRSRP